MPASAGVPKPTGSREGPWQAVPWEVLLTLPDQALKSPGEHIRETCQPPESGITGKRASYSWGSLKACTPPHPTPLSEEQPRKPHSL